jgi:hypothetical protein
VEDRSSGRPPATAVRDEWVVLALFRQLPAAERAEVMIVAEFLVARAEASRRP